MDKVVHIYKKGEVPASDLLYWLSKTPNERLEAIEFLRQQYYNYTDETVPRLQRVCTIIRKA